MRLVEIICSFKDEPEIISKINEKEQMEFLLSSRLDKIKVKLKNERRYMSGGTK